MLDWHVARRIDVDSSRRVVLSSECAVESRLFVMREAEGS